MPSARLRYLFAAFACLAASALTIPAAAQRKSSKKPAEVQKPAQPVDKTEQKAKPPADPLDAELKEAIKTAPKAAEWPNSNAARLLDLVNVEMKPDGTVIADYRTTLKLFNERARNLAEVSLPYNASYQTLTVTKART